MNNLERMFVKDVIEELKKFHPDQLTNIVGLERSASTTGTRVMLLDDRAMNELWDLRESVRGRMRR